MTLSGGEKTHCPLLCISVCEEGERNKQVSCAALSLSGLAPPPPPSQWEVLTPEGLLKAALPPAPLSVGKQKPVSCTQLLLIFFVALRSSVLRPPFFPSLCCWKRAGFKMMQEVSIMVAYDAHVVERPSEEDTLARLVARSRPLRAFRPVVRCLCSGSL